MKMIDWLTFIEVSRCALKHHRVICAWNLFIDLITILSFIIFLIVAEFSIDSAIILFIVSTSTFRTIIIGTSLRLSFVISYEIMWTITSSELLNFNFIIGIKVELPFLLRSILIILFLALDFRKVIAVQADYFMIGLFVFWDRGTTLIINLTLPVRRMRGGRTAHAPVLERRVIFRRVTSVVNLPTHLI